MECSLCQSPLAEGATVCGACGSAVVADVAEVTLLSGSRGPDTTGGPPRGEVLAERWEIEERIGSDVLMSRYRAHDQETEAHVVVTLVPPEVLPSARERDAVKDRLAAAVGIGNKFLPGLLDADREGQFVFTVEPLVVGMSLRSVLDARRARGETMHVREVLPVIAQLAAALSGIAPPQRHGDVRAERVVVGQDGLRLVGAFMLPALPAGVVSKALAADDAWRRVLAPEALRGTAADAADRFGVAAIAFEALTGKLPGRAGPTLGGGEFAAIDEALRALLLPEPGTRARSLDALIEALAECAHLPIPDLDPASFRRLRRSNVPRAATPSSVAQRPSVVVDATVVAPVPPGLDTPASAPFDAGPFDTSPAAPVDADSTARMQALNEDGELPADTLPPAYRLDDGATLPELSRQTRRVIAVQPPVAVVVAAAKPASAPAKPAPKSSPPPKPVPKSSPPAPLARPKPIAGAATGGTQEVAMEDLLIAPAAKKKRDDDSLDPRLVRAALGVASDEPKPVADAPASRKKRADDSLDPRLVRAALGVALDGADDDDDEPATAEHTAAPAAAKKPSGDTQQLTSGDLAEMASAANRRSARVTANKSPPSAPRARDAEPVEVVKLPRYDVAKKPAPAPKSVPPAPKPAPPAPSVRPAAPAAAASPAPSPSAPATPRSVPPPSRPATPRSVPPPAAARTPSVRPGAPAAAPVTARPPQRAPVATAEDLVLHKPRARSDRMVIWVSVVLALIILSVGAAVAWRREAAEAEARERRLDQRFQQLQQQP
jgi:hypothetical protein